MDSALDAALTWDPHQGHSDYQSTNDAGQVYFGVSAGGCSQAGESSASPGLRVFPNPCHDRATFETIAPAGGHATRIEVVDAGGRRVRSIAASVARRESVGWDLRDEAGRAVPAGIYFVIARFGSESRREALVVY